jgi:hypothetical protein
VATTFGTEAMAKGDDEATQTDLVDDLGVGQGIE